MPQVTILRCPASRVIGEYARLISAVLCDELGVDPRVSDGLAGEFTVFVGPREVYRHDAGPLPAPARVVELVGGTAP